MVSESAPAGRFYQLFFKWACEVGGCNNAVGRPVLRARRRYTTLPSSHSSRSHCQPRQYADVHTLAGLRTQRGRSSRAPSIQQSWQRRTHNSTKLLRQHEDAAYQAPQLPDQMRTMMRRIPHSVVIVAPVSSITERSGTGSGDLVAPLAMTVSSFNTVCLQPAPIISFNTRLPSTTLSKIEAENGKFDVFLLLAQGSAATIAHEFAGGYGEQPMRYALQKEREADPDAFPKKIKQCLTPDFDGIVAVLRCRQRVESSVDVEDHRIVVADVLEVNEVEPEPEAGPLKPNPPRFGLVYAGGKYWRIDRNTEDPLMLEWPSNAPKSLYNVEWTTSSGSSQIT